MHLLIAFTVQSKLIWRISAGGGYGGKLRLQHGSAGKHAKVLTPVMHVCATVWVCAELDLTTCLYGQLRHTHPRDKGTRVHDYSMLLPAYVVGPCPPFQGCGARWTSGVVVQALHLCMSFIPHIELRTASGSRTGHQHG